MPTPHMHRIYTRRGDQGTTSTRGRERRSKADARVIAYGALYELNTVLGWAAALLDEEAPEPCPPPYEALRRGLLEIQHRLFFVGRDLSQERGAEGRDPPSTTPDQVRRLEALLNDLAAHTPPWKPFTVPRGARPATALFMATTVCRRAETLIVALAAAEPVPDAVLAWVNRLSDLLFVAARYVNAALGSADPPVREPEDGY
jgi:cob(I)alamin adenosyltransferase